MAQTKRKRQTKHRGNAAGGIETRGRTGRPPDPKEKKQAARAQARADRLNRPPTWKQSFQRAAFAGVLMFIFLLLTNHAKHENHVIAAVAFAAVAMALYVPGGYYLEMYLYRRRMAKQRVTVSRSSKR